MRAFEQRTPSLLPASFDGNKALFTDAFTTDLGPDPNAYTIMFWIKAEDILQENNNTRLMTTVMKPSPPGGASTKPAWQVEGFGNSGSNGDKMDVRFNDDGVHPNWFSPDATNALARSDQSETAEWHHVAYILANAGHPDLSGDAFSQTFVDGIQTGLESEAAWNGVSIGNTDGQLIIGGHAENAGTRAFTGLLDDIALFAGVVDTADIQAIAAGTMSPADFIPGPSAGVPEPSTFVLGIMGVLGLIYYRRRVVGDARA